MISTEQGTLVSRISADHTIPDHISGRAMFRPGWKKPNPTRAPGQKTLTQARLMCGPTARGPARGLSPTQTSNPYFIEKSAQNSIDILKITDEESEMHITVYSS